MYPLNCIKIGTAIDQAASTGDMLSTSYNFIHYNPTANVHLFGQEINPESYAMCVAEMLIKRQNAENIRMQYTMKADFSPTDKCILLLKILSLGRSRVVKMPLRVLNRMSRKKIRSALTVASV